MPTKLKNLKTKTLIASFNGIDIYGQFQPAKRSGKNRVWIQLRQPDPRPLRVSESLSYARGVDVLFEAIE
jgi:hypothetical protein